MRHSYELSHETRTILTDNVQRIADEMSIDPSYLHHVLSGSETDCFAKVKFMANACVRAGVDITPWLASLNGIVTKSSVAKTSEIECLSDKVLADADSTDEIVKALRDGTINVHERQRIRFKVQKQLNILNTILAMTAEPVNGSRAHAKAVVKAHTNGGNGR